MAAEGPDHHSGDLGSLKEVRKCLNGVQTVGQRERGVTRICLVDLPCYPTVSCGLGQEFPNSVYHLWAIDSHQTKKTLSVRKRGLLNSICLPYNCFSSAVQSEMESVCEPLCVTR